MTDAYSPTLRQRLKKRWQAIHQRVSDAWHVLFAPTYIVYFDYGRPMPGEEGGTRGMNGGYRGLRRQDLFDVGFWCFETMAEDDEANNLLDEANELLGS